MAKETTLNFWKNYRLFILITAGIVTTIEGLKIMFTMDIAMIIIYLFGYYIGAGIALIILAFIIHLIICLIRYTYRIIKSSITKKPNKKDFWDNNKK